MGGLAAGLGSSFAVSPVYQVSAEVAVNPGAGDPLRPGELDLPTPREVLSPQRLEAVVAEVDPYPSKAGQARSPVSAVVGRLREDLEIEDAGGGAICIRYRHTDPVTAMRVLDELVTSLIAGEEEVAPSGQGAAAGPAPRDTVLDELKRRIEELNARIEGPGQRSARPASRASLEALQLQVQLRTLDDELRAAESRVRFLRESLEPVPASPLASTASSAAAELRAELEALRVRYTDEHPDVKRLRERLRLAEEAEAQATPPPAEGPDPRALQAAEDEVRRLQAKRAVVAGAGAGAVAREEAGPGPSPLDEIALVRERRQLQEKYVEALARQAALPTPPVTDPTPGPRFRLVSPARWSREPVSPSRVVFALVGFLGGLTVGVLVGWVAGRPDDRIRDPADVEALLRAPLLADIPEIRVPWRQRHRPRRSG